MVISTLLGSCVLLNELNILTIDIIIDFLNLSPFIELVGRFVSLLDLLIIALFISSARSVMRLNAVDTLFIARFFGTGKFFEIYITIAVTYLVVQNTVSRRVSVAWQAANNKYRLARLRNSYFSSYSTGFNLFISKLLMEFQDYVSSHRISTHRARFF